MRLVNIGYGNVVVAERVVAVISPDSAPMKRFKDEARKAGRLIDGTQGRRTRSILITDSHHIVLSALQTETVGERLERGSAMPAHSHPAAPLPPPTGGAPEAADAADAADADAEDDGERDRSGHDDAGDDDAESDEGEDLRGGTADEECEELAPQPAGKKGRV